MRNKKNGYYRHALNARVAGKPRKTEVTICVASRSYLHKKTCKRRNKN